ncbi:nicotinamidase-related amidase [Bradyrhizobium huanghuaihaiense]|uniref:Nicotinamidase-related amidase n=1 Tax=Bradyrhizobium huanghuaihaiense TaxID=990078 RepID=A0A562RQB8_9BRAD|nr:isochorismatase family cysteine hydrolase [Bradyrhizobium huanghuaihaiense]TWI71295.1 nicotinamidase-related amidase [Bradyrhizobium huanghuaihaiense]
MATYEPAITALLCIDFYNDFLSVGGKLWPWVKEGAEEANLLENLRTIVRAAREAGIAIYHVPHHRWEPGDYVDWKYPSPYQLGAAERQAFAKNSWGGTFHKDFQVEVGDIVATEHWASSGFPNTDLEHQLKRYGKEKIICTGLLANTCVEATARIGMELGFHVTLVRDGTAARSHEALHAMLDIDGPTFAHEILTTAELVSAIRASASAGEMSAGQASSKPL